MKKLILLLTILISMTVCVEAKTVRKAAAEAVGFFGIVEGQTPEAIYKCKNYRLVAEEDVVPAATAIGAGLLIPKNGVLDMDSEDLTPVINGITSYGIRNGYKVVTDVFANGEIDRAAVTDETFTLTELSSGEQYTALIKYNKCVAVLPLGDLKKPVLYKARMYVADGNTISFDSVMRYSLGQWMDAGLNGRLLFGQPHGFEISADILNTQYMDKTVYFYADAYEQVVKIYAMREE